MLYVVLKTLNFPELKRIPLLPVPQTRLTSTSEKAEIVFKDFIPSALQNHHRHYDRHYLITNGGFFRLMFSFVKAHIYPTI